MACDMSEPCKFPSLDSCKKRFLWTHKDVYLALHPLVGQVFKGGDAEKLPQVLGFEHLDLLFFSFLFPTVSKQGPCFTATEVDGGDKKLVELDLICEGEGVAPLDPV